MFKQVFKRTLVLPQPYIVKSDTFNLGNAVRLDSLLMIMGFKLSVKAFNYIARVPSCKVLRMEIKNVLAETVGAHVKHNVYFKTFPEGVPDTIDFWLDCVKDAVASGNKKVLYDITNGHLNLLDLPKYGKYLHSYDEMVEVHEQFIPLFRKTYKIIELGESLDKMMHNLYISFASSKIPLTPEDRGLLCKLANKCIHMKQPLDIPVRENRAIINKVRILEGQKILVTTITDILRLAAYLSDGDVTLVEPTKFKSFKRKIRRKLLLAFNNINVESQLQDINKYREEWKRLAERLHPYDWSTNLKYRKGLMVFDVAYKKIKVSTDAEHIDMAFKESRIITAINLLAKKPGVLFRNLDRVMRNIVANEEFQHLLTAIERNIDKVSTRVLLSVREHLMNRTELTETRIFGNSKGTSWIEPDNRDRLKSWNLLPLFKVIDAEIQERLPIVQNIITDEYIADVAIPVSDKNKADGYMVMPRGSEQRVTGPILRFFMYWKEKHERTDWDLSVQFLNAQFQSSGHVSYTNLKHGDVVHSGDITESHNGASEFIDINLETCKAKYIVPQVLVYSGEGFNIVEEGFFGFMERDKAQMGLPFEPSTVKYKSDLRGENRIAYPLVFIKDLQGQWRAKWSHFYAKGAINYNTVERQKVSNALRMKGITEREYLKMKYFIDMFSSKNIIEQEQEGVEVIQNMYIGLNPPEHLPEDTKVITLSNLHELI